MAAVVSSLGLEWIGTAIEIIFFGLWVCALLLATLWSGFLGWLEILRVRRIFREGWGVVRRPWLFLVGLLCAMCVVALSLSVLVQAVLQGPVLLTQGWQDQWWVVPLWSGASWGFFHTFSTLADPPGQPSWRSATTDPSVGALLATTSYATGRWLERKTWLARAWSPDGTQLAFVPLAGAHVQLWDRSQQQPTLLYTGHRKPVNSVAWSPDGRRVATASDDKTVQVWDARTGTLLLTYRGHRRAVLALAWSPDGTQLASAGKDQQVHLWDVVTGTPLTIYRGHRARVYTLAWSPNGRQMASAGFEKTAHLWDAATGQQLCIYRGHAANIAALVWSPTDKELASTSSDKTVQIWSVFGITRLTYRGHSGRLNWVNTVDWSPDGACLASGDNEGAVHVWEANHGECSLIYRGHRGGINALAWLPDATSILSVDDEGAVQVWRARQEAALVGDRDASYR
jgi:WD40 repeat protein